MSITFRADKGSALTYAEMDTNLGSYFYSSSVENYGTELVLHYKSSNQVPINQTSHRVPLLKGLAGGSDKRVAFFSGSAALSTAAGFIVDGTKVGINVNETTDVPLTYQLEVSGSIRASQAVYTNSDITFKENVTPITNGLDRILSSQGVYFNWIGDNPDNIQIGYIAQDLQKSIPEVVEEDNTGYLSVNYSSIVAVLTEAIKEQQATIEDLKQRIITLESQ